MKRNYPSFLLFIYLLIVVLLYIPFHFTLAENTTSQVFISTNPTTSVFNVHNMAPGDVESDFIEIHNKRNSEVTYQMRVNREEGSESLYNMLSFKVIKNDIVYFDDLIKEFHDLSLGSLKRNESDTLHLKIGFPLEAGNELQDTAASIAFHFVSVEKQSPPLTCEQRGDCPEQSPTTCEERGDCPEQPPTTCEERGDCPEQPPTTCEERGDCPEQPPTTCEERGDCPEQPPTTCEERGDCPEHESSASACEEQGNCLNLNHSDQVCEGEHCREAACPPGVNCAGKPDTEMELAVEHDPIESPTDPAKHQGGKLPNTSVPWYNLLLISMIGLAVSGSILWKLRR